jgi:hypothetical protein
MKPGWCRFFLVLLTPLWIGGGVGMFLIYHLPLRWFWVAPIVVFIGFLISWLILVYEKWKRINGNTGS